MCHNSFSLPWGAASFFLIVAVVCGFVLANPAQGDEAYASQQPYELSWSTSHGDGGEAVPASESSYTDYNPSCNHDHTVAVYRPTVSPLMRYEPFTALPKVYLERFVPPQNLQNPGIIS